MAKITVFDKGPLRIEGELELCDGQGAPYGLGGRKAVFLCRCGKSQDAPFCDGAHKREGFDSCPAARDLPPLGG